MSTEFTYTCVICGEEHTGAPSFAFNAPTGYQQSGNILQKLLKIKHLTDDFCQVKDGYYIRTVLEIPIHDQDEPFTWGVWSSQSKENFEFYKRNFHTDLTGRETFGWLCNALPSYENTMGLKSMVHFRGNGLRPYLVLEQTDHPLSQDFYNGISQDKAAEIFTKLIHRTS